MFLGKVTPAKAARLFGRNGRLRFLDTTLQPFSNLPRLDGESRAEKCDPAEIKKLSFGIRSPLCYRCDATGVSFP